MRKIVQVTKELKFLPKHVVEVGVFIPHECSSSYFIDAGCSAQLFEPNKYSFSELQKHFKENTKVKVYPYAISDFDGTSELIVPTHTGEGSGRGPYAQASSYLKNTKSPFSIAHGDLKSNELNHTVECRKFGQFDNNNIDILLLDCEGSEWHVLSDLHSRPTIISIEMGLLEGVSYVNPFADEIMGWMNRNNYELHTKEHVDFIYIKK